MVFQEQTYSVLLVSASEKVNMTMMPLLPSTDYYPVTTVKSISEAQRILLEKEYDIVVINCPLPDDFGMQLAINTCAESGAGVLMLVKSELYDDVYAKVVQYGVLTLSKPTNSQMVAQNLRVLCATRERMRQMQEKQMTVEKKIEEIRAVNYAKWLLIDSQHMSENEAHRYIEKRAMDQRVSKKEIADEIIWIYKKDEA